MILDRPALRRRKERRLRERATGEVLVLNDSRQRLDRGALRAMLPLLAAPQVGCVTGNLVLEGGAGSGQNVEINARLQAFGKYLMARPALGAPGFPIDDDSVRVWRIRVESQHVETGVEQVIANRRDERKLGQAMGRQMIEGGRLEMAPPYA